MLENTTWPFAITEEEERNFWTSGYDGPVHCIEDMLDPTTSPEDKVICAKLLHNLLDRIVNK